MSEPSAIQAAIEVPAHGNTAGAGAGHDLLAIDKGLALWTWVTFILVCILLYKLAWKPILAGLDQRERNIRKSLEDAERIREQMARMQETQREMIAEAETEAKAILAQARKGAAEAARVIQDKAREESEILLENATREIKAAREKAQVALRRESAELAVGLAGKIIGEKLDEVRDADLVDRLIKEL